MKRRRRWWTRTNIESKNLIPWLCILKRLLRIRIPTLRGNYILLAFHLKSKKKILFDDDSQNLNPFFQTGLQETFGSMGWKEMEIVGLVWEQCLGRLGYTLFLSYPKASTRLETRTFCQTRFRPNFDFYAVALPLLSVEWALNSTAAFCLPCHTTPSSDPGPESCLSSDEEIYIRQTKCEKWIGQSL